MCAIVDTNVYHEVFSSGSQSDAGRYFYDWLMRRNGGTIVSGGEHLRELNRIADFKRVFGERLLAGRARRIPDEVVDAETDALQSQGVCTVLMTNTFSRWPGSVVRGCSSPMTMPFRMTLGIAES